MTKTGDLDPHAQPPPHLRVLFKRWRTASVEDIHANNDLEIIDSLLIADDERLFPSISSVQRQSFMIHAFQPFLHNDELPDNAQKSQFFELKELPGLVIAPSVLSVPVQAVLLDKLFHRDCSNPQHNNNLTPFYDVPYQSLSKDAKHQPLSLFSINQNTQLQPKDPVLHKPLTIKQVLDKKLRWITLGGQYDWTNKQYPAEEPLDFPEDIATFITNVFPEIEPQAAILNLYSPGDTLSLHRDVSEDCDQPLVSISMGCDALFLVANEDGSKHAVIRIRSGDAVLMSGRSRYAWHAVPKVLANTCPPDLRNWPAYPESNQARFKQWTGWLTNKRINLNVRQMRTRT
ncbi:hypothetical protein LTS08_008662 [Lithohypha guttulata]|nr:hypothetical protein LTS08_008662 [Lithohypha guttulata]